MFSDLIHTAFGLSTGIGPEIIDAGISPEIIDKPMSKDRREVNT